MLIGSGAARAVKPLLSFDLFPARTTPILTPLQAKTELEQWGGLVYPEGIAFQSGEVRECLGTATTILGRVPSPMTEEDLRLLVDPDHHYLDRDGANLSSGTMLFISIENSIASIIITND